MSQKVVVEVFYSKTCPKCPPQKNMVKEFENEQDVKVKLTDIAVRDQRAKNHGVRAVPTTIVDGPALDQKSGFTGLMAEEKLETAINVARGNEGLEKLEKSGLLVKLKEMV